MQISGIGPDHTSNVDISPRRSIGRVTFHFLICQGERNVAVNHPWKVFLIQTIKVKTKIRSRGSVFLYSLLKVFINSFV